MTTLATAIEPQLRSRSPKHPEAIELGELARRIPDGATCALGGGWPSSHPMAVARELARNGTRVNLVALLGSIDVDLLCAADCVEAATYAFVSLDAYGTARSFRRGVEGGKILADERSGFQLIVGVEAAARGVPALPCASQDGRVAMFPELRPDVAVLHAACADERGNVGLTASPFIDVTLAHAAETVLVTVERRCTSLAESGRLTATIPHFLIDAIAVAPLGAHPTAAEPDYSTDPWAMAAWARDPAGCLERWLVPHEDYVEALDQDRIEALRG